MEIPEFIDETSKIEEYYEKELTKVQRDVWYQELKKITVDRYRRIIKQVFRECKFMPKLSDILEIDEKLPGENSKKKQKVECNMCKGSGFHPYEKIVDNGVQKLSYTFLARCECENGLEYAYDGTKISDARYRSKYYIPTIQQLGL